MCGELGFFEYKATIWDEKEILETGVTYADTFSAAAQNIEEYYGEELIKLEINAVEPYSVYVLTGPTKTESNFFNK